MRSHHPTVLATLVVLMSLGSFANAGVLKHKTCAHNDSLQKCQQYFLPFKEELTFQDYIDDLEKHTPETSWFDIYKRQTSFTYNSFMTIATYYEKLIDNKNKTAIRQFLKMSFLEAVYMLERKGVRDQLAFDRETALRVVHTLFALIHNMYTNTTPDYSRLYKTKNCQLRRIVTKDNRAHLEQVIVDNAILREPEYLCNLVRYVQTITSTFFVYSDENTNWLLEYAPELKEKQVIELGAGNGRLTKILRSKGVRIQATDNKQMYVPKGSSGVESKSIQDVFDEYDSTDEKVVFLAAVPGWDTSFYLPKLAEMKNVTMIIISEDNIMDNNLTIYFPELEISKENLPASFKTLYDLGGISPQIYTIKHRGRKPDSHSHTEL